MNKNISLFLCLFLFSCGTSSDESIEGKQASLVKIKQEILDLKLKASQLEKEIRIQSGIDEHESLRKVVVKKISYQKFNHFIKVQGNVAANKNIVVSPEVSGKIIKKYIKEGDRVNKGQVLVQLDTEILKANIEEVKTQLEFAKTVFERTNNLWQKQATTEIKYLESKNQEENLQNKLNSLDKQLKKATVLSPIQGIVDEVFMNVGETANPSLPLVRVVNLDEVKITGEISETYLNSIHKKDLVTVVLPNIEYEKNFPIAHIGQFINPNNRSFKIFLNSPNPDNLFKPNMIVILKIKDFSQDKALVVPSNSILQSTDSKRFVYTVEQNQDSIYSVKKKYITPSSTYKNNTLINEGLEENEWVITKGYDEVVDKQNVEIVIE